MKRGPYKGSFLWTIQNIPEDKILRAIMESYSIREVCTKLELKMHGSAYPVIKEFAKDRGYSMQHFLGQSANSGNRYKGNKKNPLRHFNFGKKIDRRNLRTALLAQGFKEECKICKLGPEWNGKPLTLQIDHIDGNDVHNMPQNLRFLCPNCHLQQDTSGWKGAKLKKKQRDLWKGFTYGK